MAERGGLFAVTGSSAGCLPTQNVQHEGCLFTVGNLPALAWLQQGPALCWELLPWEGLE